MEMERKKKREGEEDALRIKQVKKNDKENDQLTVDLTYLLF